MSRIINPNNDPANGGVELRKVPVIPWDAFVACGLKVYSEEKVQIAVFTPNPMETIDEAFQVMRMMMAAQVQKPGPIHWETVPEEVRKHFTIREENAAGN